jgi:hypothetical protein
MDLSFVVSFNVLINTQLHAVADKWLCHVTQYIIYLLSCNVIDRLSKIIWVRLSLFNRVVSSSLPHPPNPLYSQRGTICQVRPKMSQSNLWLNLSVEFYVHMTEHNKKFLCNKPTRCTNFTNLFCHETTCFRQFVCPSSGVYPLYTQQWYMSYRFVDSFRAGPSWWINSWCWTEIPPETCRVSCQDKFVKLVHLVGFIIKNFLVKFITC